MPDLKKDVRDEPGELRLRESSNPQDYARSHPLRLAILALLSSKRRPERSAEDLSTELPDFPTLAVVEYHLGVLRRVGLISEHEASAGAVYQKHRALAPPSELDPPA